MTKINVHQDLKSNDRKLGTILAMAYLFFYYVRPQEYIPGLKYVPIPGVLFLIFAFWGIFHLRHHIFKSPVVIVLIFGVIYFLSSIGVANVYPLKLGFKYITQFFPQCAALFILFDSRERIYKLIGLWTLIYFLMGLITIKNGGLGPGDFSRDPNDASLALAIGAPIVFYAIWQPGISLWIKYFRVLAFLTAIAGIVITGSRGGFLGLAAVLILLWWFSENRVRNLLLGVAGAALLSSVLIAVLPAGYFDEMKTINDPADNTRVERFRLWETAWLMYLHNPINGVGAGQFRFNVGEYQKQTNWWTGTEQNYQGKVVHSFYFEVLSELGTIGVIAYLYIILYLPLKLYSLRNNTPRDGPQNIFSRRIAQAHIISMGAFIVSGAFISVAYYPHLAIWATMYAIYIRLFDGDTVNVKRQ